MPGHTDKKMGSGGMDIPAISREEQVMRDLPKGNETTTDEELRRLNPNMDFRTFDEKEADKAKILQSDMMMLQNLFDNGDPMMGREIKKMMDLVGSGFTVQEIFDLMKSFDPRSVVREGETMNMKATDNQTNAIMKMLDPRSVVREGEMIGRNPTDEMMRNPMSEQALRGALGGIGAVPTTRDMGDAT